DYQCLHWYGIGFSNLHSYLEQNHNMFGLPILLTEFAEQNFNGGTQPSLADVISSSQQALEYFDNTDWILAACPFGRGFPISAPFLNSSSLLQLSFVRLPERTSRILLFRTPMARQPNWARSSSTTNTRCHCTDWLARTFVRGLNHG
ncbi:glycoside hydrolase family 128 protein, partial [Trametes sanguinea]